MAAQNKCEQYREGCLLLAISRMVKYNRVFGWVLCSFPCFFRRNFYVWHIIHVPASIVLLIFVGLQTIFEIHLPLPNDKYLKRNTYKQVEQKKNSGNCTYASITLLLQNTNKL